MKAVKKTGLVPVRHRGMVIGVPPGDAVKGFKSGEMELFPIPDGVETIDVAGFEPVVVKVEPVVSTDGLVEIPDDWRTAHGTKRAMIAKAILGLEPKAKLPVAEGQDVAEFAVSVIEEELAKRVPAEPEPPAAPIEPVPAAPAEEPPAQEPIPETPAQPDA